MPLLPLFVPKLTFTNLLILLSSVTMSTLKDLDVIFAIDLYFNNRIDIVYNRTMKIHGLMLLIYCLKHH